MYINMSTILHTKCSSTTIDPRWRLIRVYEEIKGSKYRQIDKLILLHIINNFINKTWWTKIIRKYYLYIKKKIIMKRIFLSFQKLYMVRLTQLGIYNSSHWIVNEYIWVSIWPRGTFSLFSPHTNMRNLIIDGCQTTNRGTRKISGRKQGCNKNYVFVIQTHCSVRCKLQKCLPRVRYPIFLYYCQQYIAAQCTQTQNQ